MDGPIEPTEPVPAPRGPELRRAISRQTWLANRARNALLRPAFIGAISIATFVTALVSMVVVPRARSAPEIQPAPRPDTLSLVAGIALGRVRLAQADSAILAIRAQYVADSTAAAQLAADTLSGVTNALLDSLEWRLRTLDRLRLRADQAPLAASYRALAEAPELRADPRIAPLIDSLSEIDRDRETAATLGGVNPQFVALTARANEVGRTINAIADERRAALRGQIETLAPPPPPTPVADTATQVALRDSIRSVMATSTSELDRRRSQSRALDLQEERARDRASAVAPPLALLAAAFVLSGIIGFGVAFVGELRRPRVAAASELERYLGVRVLSTVEPALPSIERGRREADRASPPYFEPSAEGYQLAYLALATAHPELLAVTVTGDHSGVAAVIACNMAAVAVDEARSTLVIDADRSCSGSAALRAPVEPGVIDVLQQRASWREATVAAQVGRDRTVDLVPCGLDAQGGDPDPQRLIGQLRQDSERLARSYDAVFMLASPDGVAAGLPTAMLAPDVVYCVQLGVTPLRPLRAELERIRSAGALVRGLVLWQAERPLLPTPRELTRRPRSRAGTRAPAQTPAAATTT